MINYHEEESLLKKIFSFPFKNLNKNARAIFLIVSIVLTFLTSFWTRYHFIDLWKEFKNQFYFNNRAILTNFDGYYYARLSVEYRKGVYDKVTNLTKDELQKLKKYYPKGAILDDKRFVPDFNLKPKPIPMLSYIFSFFKYPENASLWLIPLLASLTVVPALLFFYEINLPFAGIGAAILGAISIIFVIRTQMARLDTDALNLFFLFLIAYFLLKGVKAYEKLLEEKKKVENILDTLKEYKKIVVYPVLAGISFDLFMWWYGHIGFLTPFLGSFFISLVLTYLVYRYKEAKESGDANFSLILESLKKDKRFYISFVSLLSFLIVINPINLINAIKSAFGFFSKYVFLKKDVSYAFPNIKISIAEMQKTGGFFKAADICTSNHIVSLLGFIGFLIAFVRHFRYLILLSPFFLLGLSAINGATRFAMYLAPILGAGFGYYFDLLYSYIYYYVDGILRYISFVILGIFVAYITYPKQAWGLAPIPKLPKRLCEDFAYIGKKYKNAWLWTWWDYGYPLEYIGNVATYHDGGAQTSYKTYFVATTFSNPNQTQVANTIKTISLIGLYGINKFLEKPNYFFEKLGTNAPSQTNLIAKKIRDYIFEGKVLENNEVLKELLAPYFKIRAASIKNENHLANKLLSERPILFAFTNDEIGKFFWINRFGTWNFLRGDGDKEGFMTLPCGIGKLKTGSPALVCTLGQNQIIVDLITGASNFPQLKKLVVINNGHVLFEKNINSQGKFVIEYIGASKNLKDIGNGVKLPLKNLVGIYLITDKTYKSAFNQMYLLGRYDKRYFEEVYNDFPYMRVYRLKVSN